MADGTVFVKENDLVDFCTALFRKGGMPEKDARYSAVSIVQSNLWGVDSHGVIRLPAYIERLRNGAVNPDPKIKAIKEFGAIARLDGDNGMGYVVGRETMAKAISLAGKYGIGSVVSCRSNHFGAAGLFAREAARKNLIGISISNTVVNMAAPGSIKPVLGNHPIAFAFPFFDAPPFVLDMCTSQVAGGKIRMALQKGEKIPLGWAVDKDGNPTEDPAAGLAGAYLPMGGHKGYGLALVIEQITGLLSGGAILSGMKDLHKCPEEPSGISHHMIAVNPLAVMEKEEWIPRAEALRAQIKKTPMRQVGEQLVFPGELEDACEAKRRKEGLPMPASLFETLNVLGSKFSEHLEKI
jgi:LDH2 family malate/lactate/ureidoglycolate dehydrogenase